MGNYKEYVCCLCGKVKKGYGNNPWPLVPVYEAAVGERARCCDGCNTYKVIPARLKNLMEDKDGKNK